MPLFGLYITKCTALRGKRAEEGMKRLWIEGSHDIQFSPLLFVFVLFFCSVLESIGHPECRYATEEEDMALK